MEKHALITGGAKRVGKAIANHLAKNGWSITIHYNHSSKEAEKLKEELSQAYTAQNFYAVKANLSDMKDVLKLIPKVKKQMGSISLLVNNASIFEASAIKETTPELFERNMQINFTAPFFLTRDFAIASSSGIIINFVDTRITTNKNSHAAYTMAKKSLWELTKMSAFEFGPEIRVNAIAPGVTLPPPGGNDSDLLQMAKHLPMQKPSGIDPILRSIDYIIVNDHLTGQLLFCDGGENLGKI
ncbi:MAG TPA: SDR family NAD(P)-dependent oxidoreductase [Prolixibacteraceae bacterium]|nr:SDR family NAD(P)-dependent oxidoreductase [Prolixibacteraceae bacterium]